MIRGYRWVKTGIDVWLFESKLGYFHGKVEVTFDPCVWVWCMYGDYPRGQGEAPTRRAAMDCVENCVRRKGINSLQTMLKPKIILQEIMADEGRKRC